MMDLVTTLYGDHDAKSSGRNQNFILSDGDSHTRQTKPSESPYEVQSFPPIRMPCARVWSMIVRARLFSMTRALFVCCDDCALFCCDDCTLSFFSWRLRALAFARVRGPFLTCPKCAHLANIALTQATLLASGVSIQGRTQLGGLEKTLEILL